MKKCELCKLPARTYCESDQANLCWTCDTKVHGANFLVARHSRGLLCRACQSLTSWQASGAKLGHHTVSICERCACNRSKQTNNQDQDRDQDQEQEHYCESATNDDDDQEDEEEEEDEDDDDDDDDDDEDGDGDGENQVVPLSSMAPPSSPPLHVTASSSCSSSSAYRRERAEFVNDVDDENDRNVYDSANAVSLKRTRESSTDLRSSFLKDDINRSSSKRRYGHDGLTCRDGGGDCCYSLRALKGRRIEPDREVQGGSGTVAVIESVRRFHGGNSGDLSEECEAVDDVELSGNCSRSI